MKAGSGAYREDSLNRRGEKMSHRRLGFCRGGSLQPVLAINEDSNGDADWEEEPEQKQGTTQRSRGEAAGGAKKRRWTTLRISLLNTTTRNEGGAEHTRVRERSSEFETNYEFSDDNEDEDNANDLVVQAAMRTIIHNDSFGIPPFMRVLDLNAMCAPRFPENELYFEGISDIGYE
ncbi:hypothetical protein PIB30_056137 [Stylosanthes scabra]|uniref:Uncharacterized protein n=1 Tax=Stylosanthes scabra TaxID=79078 RepID=A0ABU6TJP0_9FABA|nr:hypothetical protein [Stylosanthes scabra]